LGWFVRQGHAPLAGPILHLFVVLKAKGLSLLLGLHAAHPVRIFDAFLLRHELAAENTVLIALLHAVAILAFVLCRRVCGNTCGSHRDDHRSSTQLRHLTFKHINPRVKK